MARIRWGAATILACAAVLYASDKKDKPKPAASQIVDEGSFGVFVKGQRVVTETFSVQQDNGVSVIKSQLKETGGSTSGQKFQPQKAAPAELVRYEWGDGRRSPGVTPKNDFLRGKITNPLSFQPTWHALLL